MRGPDHGQAAYRWTGPPAEPEWLPRWRVRQATGRVRYHFWKPGGGYDRNLWQAESVWAAIAYLHMNPVRRGLCDHPEDWEWSSARWYAGDASGSIQMDPPPDGPTPAERARGRGR